MTHDDIVHQVTEKAREVFPALRRLLLFGSRARGDAKPDSDYDLLVVTPLPDGARNRTVALRMALLDLLGLRDRPPPRMPLRRWNWRLNW